MVGVASMKPKAIHYWSGGNSFFALKFMEQGQVSPRIRIGSI